MTANTQREVVDLADVLHATSFGSRNAMTVVVVTSGTNNAKLLQGSNAECNAQTHLTMLF